MRQASEAITWQELKHFCNQLPETVLSKRVYLHGTDRGFRVQEAACFEEDQHDTGEGYAALSDLKDSVEDFNIGDYPLVYEAGDPMLFTDIEEDETAPAGSGKE